MPIKFLKKEKEMQGFLSVEKKFCPKSWFCCPVKIKQVLYLFRKVRFCLPSYAGKPPVLPIVHFSPVCFLYCSQETFRFLLERIFFFKTSVFICHTA